jgi:hypothetical protein
LTLVYISMADMLRKPIWYFRKLNRLKHGLFRMENMGMIKLKY